MIHSDYLHDGKLTDLNDVKPKAYKYYYLVIPTQYEYVVNNSADLAEIIEIEDFKLLTHSENSFDQIFTSDIKNIVSDNNERLQITCKGDNSVYSAKAIVTNDIRTLLHIQPTISYYDSSNSVNNHDNIIDDFSLDTDFIDEDNSIQPH